MYEQLISLINAVRPKCIQNLETKLVEAREVDGGLEFNWRLGCDPEFEPCEVLGEQAHRGDGTSEIVGGVAIRYNSESPLLKLYHPLLHGYHAEASIVGLPGAYVWVDLALYDQVSYSCGLCCARRFLLRSQIFYGEPAIESFADDPGMPIWDYFTSFFLYGTCFSCGKEWLVAQFEDL